MRIQILIIGFKGLKERIMVIMTHPEFCDLFCFYCIKHRLVSSSVGEKKVHYLLNFLISGNYIPVQLPL